MPSLLKFAVILLIAAVVALLGRSWLVARSERVAAPEPTVQIAIAAVDLPTGLLLRENDLAWMQVDLAEAPQNAIRQDQPITGALLRHSIAQGQVLRSSDVIRSDAPGFLAAALKPGTRAVSVPVDDVSGNAGLIQPGDYVDMILTQQIGPTDYAGRDAGAVVSETVVRQARVIAVGSVFQRESTRSTLQARTVTIEVSPQGAEAVTVAARLGSLSMALRSFAVEDREAALSAETVGAQVVAWEEDGRQTSHEGPVWGSDVSQALASPRRPGVTQQQPRPAAAPPAPQRITIMRGNQTQQTAIGSSGN